MTLRHRHGKPRRPSSAPQFPRISSSRASRESGSEGRAFLRRFTYDFIEMFAPRLTRTIVESALETSPAN
jgi:hypothetical protein